MINKFKRKKSFFKRFIIKSNVLIKRLHSFKKHILTKKSSKTKRFLGKSTFISKGDFTLIRKIIF